MKLHEDRAAFETIIDTLAGEHHVRRDVLEKDYYVTLLLNELSLRENQSYAYFKGGTALYKALKSIRRFSEDIDLTVYIDNCPSENQKKVRLKNAALKFTSLAKGTENVDKGSITCEYNYQSLFDVDTSDTLQRFGKVKVEATSFTVSEPTESMEIVAHLYELSSEDTRKILREQYDVIPFDIKTISLERIFIDKVFASQFYFERNEFFDVAKHIYDITVLLENLKIIEFLKHKEKVEKIVSYKRLEEQNRKGGIAGNKLISEFGYLHSLNNNGQFWDKFEDMQKIYVFNDKDRLRTSDVINAIQSLENYFSGM